MASQACACFLLCEMLSFCFSHQTSASESQAGLAQAKAELAMLRQSEERQRQRIESLDKTLADERAQKDERIQALTRTLHDVEKSLHFNEAKTKRLEDQLVDSRKEIALKQQSFTATSTQLDSQVPLSATHFFSRSRTCDRSRSATSRRSASTRCCVKWTTRLHSSTVTTAVAWMS